MKCNIENPKALFNFIIQIKKRQNMSEKLSFVVLLVDDSR